MPNIEELCAIARDHQTKMADAMLAACVREAIAANIPLSLSPSDVERYLGVIGRDPYLIGT